jgi:hypothetical protein
LQEHSTDKFLTLCDAHGLPLSQPNEQSSNTQLPKPRTIKPSPSPKPRIIKPSPSLEPTEWPEPGWTNQTTGHHIFPPVLQV